MCPSNNPVSMCESRRRPRGHGAFPSPMLQRKARGRKKEEEWERKAASSHKKRTLGPPTGRVDKKIPLTRFGVPAKNYPSHRWTDNLQLLWYPSWLASWGPRDIHAKNWGTGGFPRSPRSAHNNVFTSPQGKVRTPQTTKLTLKWKRNRP